MGKKNDIDKRLPYVAPHVETYTVWLGDSLLAATTQSVKETVIIEWGLEGDIEQQEINSGSVDLEWSGTTTSSAKAMFDFSDDEY